MTFLVVALQSEARPLVGHFRLSGTDAPGPYRLYRNDRITLVVSGIGRIACAAATAYAFARAGEPRNQPWVNIGIAGHANIALGSARLAHRIVDRPTERAWYPSLVFEPPVATAEVVTVDRPELDLPGNALFDMEASAFFATASRFGAVELVQVLKVVSDNRESPVAKIDKALVSRLIEGHLESVAAILDETEALALRLDRRSPDLTEWRRTARFSVSQSRRLAELLERLEVVEKRALSPLELPRLEGAREILAALERRLRLRGAAY